MKKSCSAAVAALAVAATLCSAVPALAAQPACQFGNGCAAQAPRCMMRFESMCIAMRETCSFMCPGGGWVDLDADGVCDNAPATRQGGGLYVDADGDGVCDNASLAGRGNGRYVDADGDGTCDNAQSGRHGLGKGGLGNGQRGR